MGREGNFTSFGEAEPSALSPPRKKPSLPLRSVFPFHDSTTQLNTLRLTTVSTIQAKISPKGVPKGGAEGTRKGTRKGAGKGAKTKVTKAAPRTKSLASLNVSLKALPTMKNTKTNQTANTFINKKARNPAPTQPKKNVPTRRTQGRRNMAGDPVKNEEGESRTLTGSPTPLPLALAPLNPPSPPACAPFPNPSTAPLQKNGWRCPYCGKSFSASFGMKYHMDQGVCLGTERKRPFVCKVRKGGEGRMVGGEDGWRGEGGHTFFVVVRPLARRRRGEGLCLTMPPLILPLLSAIANHRRPTCQHPPFYPLALFVVCSTARRASPPRAGSHTMSLSAPHVNQNPLRFPSPARPGLRGPSSESQGCMTVCTTASLVAWGSRRRGGGGGSARRR